MSALRLATVGGYLSYRALFNWVNPWLYVPALLIGPVFQIVFFAYLGRFSGTQSDSFYVVGNALQICAIACVTGNCIAFGNERRFETLPAILTSPANRLALVIVRGIHYIVDGIAISAVGFLASRLLLDFDPPIRALVPLSLIIIATVTSCTALGLALGALVLRVRDASLYGQLVYLFMLVACGGNVPRDLLPDWLRLTGDALPSTHGIQAARNVLDGKSIADVQGLVFAELGVAAGYAALAFVLFRVLEHASRRHATNEGM
jgi:ABC-2 type transport system permease protein